MAFQDNDYIKAPYLQAGDSLKINGTNAGFSIKAGNTGFIYGTNDGTLTMGEAGVPTSIPALNINAREINWNGRPLEEYFSASGGSSTGLDELSTRVDDLQMQLSTYVAELKETDEVFISEIEDLRLKSLGASVDILQNTINNYATNICGIVIPVSLIQAELNSFNTIRLGGIRNDINCYVSIYHSSYTTPSVNNQFTLLHKDATLVEASGTNSQPASVDIHLSTNVSLPTSGILLILFATSSSAPSNTGIDWIIDTSIEANLTLSVYSAGTSNPTSSNGVWLFKKSTGPTFVTYVPDIQITFTGHADAAVLRVDSELRRKIDTLETDYTRLHNQVEYLETSSSEYMTESETNSAIANYRSAEGNLNLGTLVSQLTTSNVWSLVKGGVDFQIDTAGMHISDYSNDEEHSELNVTATCVTALAVTTGPQSSEFILKPTLTSLSQINGSTAGITQLSLSDGRLNMQLANTSMSSGFSMEALHPSAYTQQTMVRMMYYDNYQSMYSSLTLSPNEAELRYVASQGVSSILTLSTGGCTLGISSISSSPWDGLVGTTSQYVPTISIVHYLIQSALANQ